MFYVVFLNIRYMSGLIDKVTQAASHFKEQDNPELYLLFNAFKIWLEDKLVRDCTRHTSTLGVRYSPLKLTDLINGDRVCLVNFNVGYGGF